MRYLYSEYDLVEHYNLKPADKLVVPKSGFRIVQHHALYLGYDDNGNHWICENVFGVGVKVSRAKDFFAENPSITRIERFSGDGDARRTAVHHALTKVGKPYNLINYNCEHFVNDVLKRRPHSPQVANVAGLAFGLLVIGLLLRGK